MTGPVGVGVVIVTGADTNEVPVPVPTSFVQSSGCAARVIEPLVNVPLAWLYWRPRLVTFSVTPGMPEKAPFAICAVIAVHMRVSFAAPVGVITASASVPLETVKPTPPAPMVRLWPTGIDEAEGRERRIDEIRSGRTADRIAAPVHRDDVPVAVDVDADLLLLEGEGHRPVDEAEEVDVRRAGRRHLRAVQVDRRAADDELVGRLAEVPVAVEVEHRRPVQRRRGERGAVGAAGGVDVERERARGEHETRHAVEHGAGDRALDRRPRRGRARRRDRRQRERAAADRDVRAAGRAECPAHAREPEREQRGAGDVGGAVAVQVERDRAAREHEVGRDGEEAADREAEVAAQLENRSR